MFAGADPPVHTAHRRIFAPRLTPREVAVLEPYLAQLVDELLDALLLDDRCDAAAGLSHPLPTQVVAERVIGFRDPDLVTLRRWVTAGSTLGGGMLGLEEMATRSVDVADMVPWMSAPLDQALAHPTTEGLLGATAVAVREGALARDDAVFNLMVLLGAGAETTRRGIEAAHADMAVGEHPEAHAS